MADEYANPENEQYCVNSYQKRNVDSMNQASGYNNMSDRANTGKPPVAMRAAKSNSQVGPKAG